METPVLWDKRDQYATSGHLCIFFVRLACLSLQCWLKLAGIPSLRLFALSGRLNALLEARPSTRQQLVLQQIVPVSRSLAQMYPPALQRW
jgi:hypothetical protein